MLLIGSRFGRRLRRRPCAVFATWMAVFVAVALPATSVADPGYGTGANGPSLGGAGLQSGQSGQTSTQQGQLPPIQAAPNTPALPSAKPVYKTRCVVTKARARVCTYYKDGHAYKRCTKKLRAKKYACKNLGGQLRNVAAAEPGRRIASISNQGWANPVVPAIGRFYLNGQGWCSGTLVLRGVVLTAGHCIYANGVDRAPDGTSNHYYDFHNMVFTPGNRINPSDPFTGLTSFGNWTVKNMWTTTAWQGNDQTRDWALVELNPDANGKYPGDTTGTFPVYYGMQLHVGQQLQAIGYPASYLFASTQFFTGNGQFFVTSSITDSAGCASGISCASVFVKYDSVMTGGSSGGPIFYLDSDNQWKLSGVVNRGLTKCQCNAPPNNDYGLWQLTAYMDSTLNDFYADVINQIRAGA